MYTGEGQSVVFFGSFALGKVPAIASKHFKSKVAFNAANFML